MMRQPRESVGSDAAKGYPSLGVADGTVFAKKMREGGVRSVPDGMPSLSWDTETEARLAASTLDPRLMTLLEHAPEKPWDELTEHDISALQDAWEASGVSYEEAAELFEDWIGVSLDDEAEQTRSVADTIKTVKIMMVLVFSWIAARAELQSVPAAQNLTTQEKIWHDEDREESRSLAYVDDEIASGSIASAVLAEAIEDDTIAALARELSTEQLLRLSDEFRRAGAFSKLREVLGMEPGVVAPEAEIEVLNEHLAKLHEQKKFATASKEVHERVVSALRDYAAAVGGHFEGQMKRTGERVRVTLTTISPNDDSQTRFGLNRQGGNGRLFKHTPELPFLEIRLP